jgi:hypothetical protein
MAHNFAIPHLQTEIIAIPPWTVLALTNALALEGMTSVTLPFTDCGKLPSPGRVAKLACKLPLIVESLVSPINREQ